MKSSRQVRVALGIAVLVLALVLSQLGQSQVLGQQSVPPPAGLVSWWPGDGNANDIVDGNNGTLHGGASFASGMVGQAFLLDPASPLGPSFVDVGNAPNLHVSAGDFTVDAWVKFNALAGDMSIVDKITGNVNVDGWRLIKQSDNRFWFCLGGLNGNHCGDPAFTVFSATTATTGVWYHVTVVKTSINFSIYVNAALQDTRPLPTFLDSNSTDLLIGANAIQGAYLNGLIDEVELFNRALLPAEISAIFNAGSAGKTKRAARAYVANTRSNSLSVIDTSHDAVVATVVVGANPVHVAITPNGASAYVTNARANSVSVIDTATNTVVATVPVGANPVDVAVTPDGTKAYVTNAGANTVSVIDTTTHTVIATVTVGPNPVSVAFTPDGTKAYVTNAGSNTVSVISTAMNAVIATVPVGLNPVNVVLH